MADEPPTPTPAEGPDPYGNPEPEWLEVDWSRIRFNRLLEAFLAR